MAASSRDAQEGMAAAAQGNNTDTPGRRTDARTKITATAATMATEEENQKRMSTRFTVKSRKRANDPEEEEGATTSS